MVIILGWFMPLDSKFANWMEILNEMTTMYILYMVLCFSDFVIDPATRHMCGYMFIGVLATFVLIHLSFLVVSTYKAIRHSIRSYYYEGKRKTANEAIEARITAFKLAR